MKHHYFWSLVILLSLIEVYSIFPNKSVTGPFPNINIVRLSAPGAHPFVSGIIHVHSQYSDGGGSPEAIAEAAYKLISDKELRDDIIKKGLENVKRFGWEKTAGEIVKILTI